MKLLIVAASWILLGKADRLFLIVAPDDVIWFLFWEFPYDGAFFCENAETLDEANWF